jgi:Na+/proline symporter
VAVSRLGVFLLAALAVLVAARISSIESAWRFFIALGAGLGLPSMLRWIWWRVNAWTEIVGMAVATAAALILYPLFPDVRDEYLLLVIIAVSMTAAFTVTFLTAPVPEPHLAEFVRRVRPPGWWGTVPGAASRQAMRWIAAAWVAGNIGVFGITFGIGHAVLDRPLQGALMIIAGLVAIRVTLLATAQAREGLGG